MNTSQTIETTTQNNGIQEQFCSNSKIYTIDSDGPIIGERMRSLDTAAQNSEQAPLLKENQLLKQRIKELTQENIQLREGLLSAINSDGGFLDSLYHVDPNQMMTKIQSLERETRTQTDINRGMAQDLELVTHQKIMYKEQLESFKRDDELIKHLQSEVERLYERNESVVAVLQGEITNLNQQKCQLQTERQEDKVYIQKLESEIQNLSNK